MARSNTSRFKTMIQVILAVVVTGATLAGCGGGAERALLQSFFRASQVDDRATAGNVSMVAFDVREQGVVSGISVRSVTEETRRPLRTRDLAEALAQAQTDEQEHAVQMREYQDENLEAIARVIGAERTGEDVAGADEEVQQEWVRWRQQSATHSSAVSNGEVALADESRVAERSTFSPSNPIDVRGFDGELVSKDVTITANVELDGNSEERTMVITLQMVELGSGEDMIEGRWIISAIE